MGLRGGPKPGLSHGESCHGLVVLEGPVALLSYMLSGLSLSSPLPLGNTRHFYLEGLRQNSYMCWCGFMDIGFYILEILLLQGEMRSSQA